MADEPAVDIGEAIQRGVELLAQQSVETPKFKLATVADLYREGVRATKSRAPAARVLEAWSGAAAEMPAPLPMAIERALEELAVAHERDDALVASVDDDAIVFDVPWVGELVEKPANASVASTSTESIDSRPDFARSS